MSWVTQRLVISKLTLKTALMSKRYTAYTLQIEIMTEPAVDTYRQLTRFSESVECWLGSQRLQ